MNGIYVTPGPFSLYRRSVIEQVGGFRHAHQAEDMEMALRLQKAGYEIENAPRARVYTKVPRHVGKLIKQRTRWTTGFLRNVMGDYREMVGNPRYGILGLMVLPLGFVAVLGGVGLFLLAILMLGSDLIHTAIVTSGVPFLFIITPRFSVEWFYAPMTFITVISFVVMIISTSFIIMGQYVSRTRTDLTMSILGYALLYGFIAPFWLVRALTDVATNTKRAWR